MNVATENPVSSSVLFSYRVKKEDCDKYQHLNHAECFRILERARWKSLAEWGCSEAEVKQKRVGPVIIAMDADFRKEILETQELEISTHAELLNSRFFCIHQRVEIQGSLHVRAKFKHGLFSLDTRSLIVIPEEWTQIFRIKN